MLSYLFDFIFVLVALSVAYSISRKSMVHSAAFFIAVLIASLLAITTFEPVAEWVDRTYLRASDYRVSMHLYFFSSIGIFASTLAILNWCIHLILPDAPAMSLRVEKIGRWVFGTLTGYLFASFMLTAVLTFPASREYWGTFPPEAHRRSGPITACAPDYQFLALTEYTCEHTFALMGGAWLLDRPVISADSSGRWSSFPIRYAMWRENHRGRK